MRLSFFSAFAATFVSLAQSVELTGYEYVVVGSGAGGGPVAARLAMAGHKTLLIEAGDDQGTNVNYTIPAYNAKSSEDDKLSWDFYVRHYADEETQARDWKMTYENPDGSLYVGLDPPADATPKGILYPRTGTLGGCTAHNALIAVYPHRSDFEYIEKLTGDTSWGPDNMRNYFKKLEQNQYPNIGGGHGHDGWLQTEQPPLSIVLEDVQLLSMLTGGAWALQNYTGGLFNTIGSLVGGVIDLGSLLAGDVNADSESRDKDPGYYQIPLSTNDAHRTGSREFVVAVRDAVDSAGNKMYPLDVRLNCHVTKVNFDESVTPPKATGVEFLDGKHLYSASPLSKNAEAGVPGSATASREVILAGGVYNSPQLLKLSGVGPADELEKFNISVVADRPGVGTNLQDHYEISVNANVPANWTAFDGCTWSFDGEEDSCIDRWENDILGNHGTYSSAGLAATMLYKSTVTDDDSFDVFVFGGPVNFRGYFPGYSYNATHDHDWFSWAILKAHPRNRAGSVTLRSADPLDTPDILFNYFQDGADEDLQALYEAINLARDAYDRQPVETTEMMPGSRAETEAEIKQYVRDGTWGHHASSTCPIGTDDDPMAVLDPQFRVRGVSNLRVVDASVYPRIPGTFTAVSTYMVAEKAADVILQELDAAADAASASRRFRRAIGWST
ncbi:choline dehydrogenase [Xylariomycetidae sp. FL0641]|nr:choline dehydrogenase [Xylariomycetidae sp. FL0641]